MPPKRFFEDMSPSLLRISGRPFFLSDLKVHFAATRLRYHLSKVSGVTIDNSLLMPVHPARDQIYHEMKW